MTPEQALKIAASQWKDIPTAEQILAALSAAGFVVGTGEVAATQPVPMMTGEEMKALRLSQGLTQLDVADHLMVSPNAVSLWESGATFPTHDKWAKLHGLFSGAFRRVGSVDEPAVYLKSILAKHNITATELARKIGVAQSTLNRQINVPGYLVSTRTLKKVREWDASQLS